MCAATKHLQCRASLPLQTIYEATLLTLHNTHTSFLFANPLLHVSLYVCFQRVMFPVSAYPNIPIRSNSFHIRCTYYSHSICVLSRFLAPSVSLTHIRFLCEQRTNLHVFYFLQKIRVSSHVVFSLRCTLPLRATFPAYQEDTLNRLFRKVLANVLRFTRKFRHVSHSFALL